MTAGILRGRHRLAFPDINRVDDLAFRIDDLVGSRLGTGIAAIQSHVFTSDTPNMGGFSLFIRTMT